MKIENANSNTLPIVPSAGIAPPLKVQTSTRERKRYSCRSTVDVFGFLTTATSSQIETAQNGALCGIFRDARFALTGDETVLETKHAIRQPLGWRTRGQATLIAGPENPDDPSYHIVLAKSGIYTPPELDTDDLENEMIVNLFFDRDPDQKIRVAAKTGIRDMINYDADLVEKNVEKHLNMEFDWKRRPYAAADGATGHLCFSTIPWRTVNDFKDVRDLWDDYQSGGYKCLKRHAQLNDFLSSAQIRLMTPKGKRAYLSVLVLKLRRQRCSPGLYPEEQIKNINWNIKTK